MKPKIERVPKEPYQRDLWLLAQLDTLCAQTMRLIALQQENLDALTRIADVMTRRAGK